MIRVWIGKREGEGGLMLNGNKGKRGSLEEIQVVYNGGCVV